MAGIQFGEFVQGTFWTSQPEIEQPTLEGLIRELAAMRWTPGDLGYAKVSADALTMYAQQVWGLPPDAPVDLNTVGASLRERFNELVDLEREKSQGQ